MSEQSTDNTQLVDQMYVMLEMQDALNSVTAGTDWRANGFEWHRAIYLEAAEAIESLPWKWWKSAAADWENLQVELVDIWHFVMSWALQEHLFENGGYTFEQITQKALDRAALLKESYQEVYYLLNDEVRRSKSVIDELEAIIHLASDPGAYEPGNYDLVAKVMVHLLGLWAYLYPLEELPIHYKTKNWLNQFRQEQGYKNPEVEYNKVVNGVEDNAFAWAFLSENSMCSQGDLFKALVSQGYGQQFKE